MAFSGLTDSAHTVLCRFINNPTMAIYCHFPGSYFCDGRKYTTYMWESLGRLS